MDFKILKNPKGLEFKRIIKKRIVFRANNNHILELYMCLTNLNH